MLVSNKWESPSEKAERLRNEINPKSPRSVKAKCMDCGSTHLIRDKETPCPCCLLCGSLAWQDVKFPPEDHWVFVDCEMY